MCKSPVPPFVVDVPAVLEDARFGALWLKGGYDPGSAYSAGARLLDLLAERGVDYVLVGGLAYLQWVEGRNTQDVDLVVAPGDVLRLPELLITAQDQDIVHAVFERLLVDLFLTRHTLVDQFKRRYVTTGRVVGRPGVPTATPEGLVFLKLFALPSLYRRGQNAKAALYETDILTLLAAYDIDTEPLLLTVLATDMLATDIAVLRDLVAEIRARIARGSRFAPGPSIGLPL